MSYTHLSLKQRFRLEIWSDGEMPQVEMADRLGVSPSTVSRELSRHGGRCGDDARKAQSTMRKERKGGKHLTKKLLTDVALCSVVEEKLCLAWSPEQITGRVRRQGGLMVCHETIYQYIYTERPEWKEYLRQKKRK